jgi:hypothetical protein
MAFRSNATWPKVARALVVTVSGLMTAPAQAQRNAPPPYRPAPDAKDLRAVLFNWTWYMGIRKAAPPPGTPAAHARPFGRTRSD